MINASLDFPYKNDSSSLCDRLLISATFLAYEMYKYNLILLFLNEQVINQQIIMLWLFSTQWSYDI